MAWIDSLFRKMVEVGASDLHLTSNKQPTFRVDGSIQVDSASDVLTRDQMEGFLIEIAPQENWRQFQETGDTDFAYELAGTARFRANYFRDHRGSGAVFRLIPSEILSSEQLGLPPSVLDLCALTKGLVVVTGPTGSGKSTTLAAMIDHINRSRAEHIITIEDPIEFVHPDKRCLVNQREVGRHTRGFKNALRAALREDPDIVLVGEMRDLETVEIAIETAETGHLVFGTLHTTTAASTIDRIIDQFPAGQQAQIRTMLSESLKGVVAQTLCKKIPKGRVAALEIMMVTTAIAANIREGKTHQIPSLMQMGRKYGMQMLNDALLQHVKEGLVDPLEAYRKAVSKEDMKQKLDGIGKPPDLSKLGEVDEAAPPPPLPKTPAPAFQKPEKRELDVAPAGAAPAAPLPQAAAPAPAPEPPAEPEESRAGYEDPFEAFKRAKR